MEHADLSAASLSINVDVGHQHQQRQRVKLYLAGQAEELLPFYEYEGVTLVNQNVRLSCESDRPDIVEARSDTAKREGYFCVIRFKGVKRGQDHSLLPEKVSVTVRVGAVDESGHELYNQVLKNFDVRLTSNVHVAREAQRGLKISGKAREKEMIIVSMGDLEVQSDVGTDWLMVQKAKRDNNQYVVSLYVPDEVKEDFAATLTLKNRLNDHTETVAVNFVKGYEEIAYVAQTPTPDPIVTALTGGPDDPKAGSLAFATKLILVISALICCCSNVSVADIFHNGGELSRHLSASFVTALTGGPGASFDRGDGYRGNNRYDTFE